MLSFNSFHFGLFEFEFLNFFPKVYVPQKNTSAKISLAGQLEIIWNFTWYVLSKCFAYGKGITTLVFCKPFTVLKQSGYVYNKIWKMSLIITPIFSIHLWTSFFHLCFLNGCFEAWMFLLWFSFLVDTW